MRINLTAQMGKSRHGAGRPVPCHTRSFIHRAKQKPLSWVRELVLSIARSVAAHCRGLGGTPAKGHFTLDLPLSAPSPGSCHQALAMRAAQLGPKPPPPPPPDTCITQVLATQHLHAFAINEAVRVARAFDLPGLQRRRRQLHYYQPTERTQYEPLKSR